jgi:hypothetical protein
MAMTATNSKIHDSINWRLHQKFDANFWKTITPKEKLLVTLRYVNNNCKKEYLFIYL